MKKELSSFIKILSIKAVTKVTGKVPQRYLASELRLNNPWKEYNPEDDENIDEEESKNCIRIWREDITYSVDDYVLRGSSYYQAVGKNKNKNPSVAANRYDTGKNIKGVWIKITGSAINDIPGICIGGDGGGTGLPTDQYNLTRLYAWSKDVTYHENKVCAQGGNFYKAKWWTKGDDPSLLSTAQNEWDPPWEKTPYDEFSKLLKGTPPPIVHPDVAVI